MQLDTIAPELQSDIIASFWAMLRQCEEAARNTNSPVDKHFVEGWYRQWNAMTGDSKKPAWLS